MSPEDRAFCNLVDYLMRARHVQLVELVDALARELIMRSLDSDGYSTELLRVLRRSDSLPRAEQMVRPL